MSVQITEELLERIVTEIENLLMPRGYRKTKHQYQPHASGSLYSVFESPERIVRFIWDGRAGRLTLRVYDKRSWAMKLAKALLGRADGEKLTRELVVKKEKLAEWNEEQLVQKCVQTLE
jgi:hypothetical protein